MSPFSPLSHGFPFDLWPRGLPFPTIMKSFLILIASTAIGLGQATVVESLSEGGDIFDIGIIPVEDFEQAQSEITSLRIALQNAEQERANFATRKKSIIARINEMEVERAKASEGMRQKMVALQAGFGKKQGEWEQRIMLAEDQRDAAIRKFEESELIRVRDNEAWKKSVKKWQLQAQESMRQAQIKGAQQAVENTARLAKDWQAEREQLLGQIKAIRMLREDNNKAWQASVDEWQEQSKARVRTAQVQAAQEAVANTARLSADWQAERELLEQQVDELSVKLAKLEGELGVQGFEAQQTERLRIGLVHKSKVLNELGTDAARLAGEWRKEREETQHKLAQLQQLSEGSMGKVKARDARIAELKKKLNQKNKALNSLAIETEKLSLSWGEQRGGLQKKIADLEQSLKACATELANVREKEEQALRQQAGTKEQSNAKLAEQLALIANLSQSLGTAKHQEEKLKVGLATLQDKHAGLNGELEKYRQRSEKDARTIANLQEELKKTKDQQALAEKNLAKAEEKYTKAQKKIGKLTAESAKLQASLQQVQDELKAVHQEAADGKAAQVEVQKKAKKIQGLEAQLVRLEAAQEGLEESLTATFGDFEKLQTAYIQLKTKTVEGEKLTQKAIVQRKAIEAERQSVVANLKATEAEHLSIKAELKAAKAKRQTVEAELDAVEAKRQTAEAELEKLRKRLKGEEGKLRQAENKAKEAEREKKKVEAAAQENAEAAVKQAAEVAKALTAKKAAVAAGKAALGKSEAELQKAREELVELQLGHTDLEKEASALRQRFVHIEPVRYELASANVVAQQQRVLAEVKQVLEVYPQAKFSIKGHTCNLGNEAGNLKLSEERAILLKTFLLENGVEASRIVEATGSGDKEPQASNETDEGRRQNRRVEINVIR